MLKHQVSITILLIIISIILLSSERHQINANDKNNNNSNNLSLKKLFKKFTNLFQNNDNNDDPNNPNKRHQLFVQRMQQYESQLNSTKVWLTVSPVVNVTDHDDDDDHRDLIVRALEIHWRSPKIPNPGDYLGLYRVNDSVQLRTYPLIDSISNKTFPRYYKTNLQFDYQNLTNLSMIRVGDMDCLEYYLTYVNHDGQIESFNCIHMRARWMQQEFELIQNQKLSDLMLPGTHDTSSYEKYDYNQYENDILNRFQYTQDESIYNQLAYGIRYMDWRVAVYNQTNDTNNNPLNYHEEFWMVHDMQRNRVTLKQALRQVVRYLERTTHEVIIIDFHRFVHGFDGEKDLQAVRRRLRAFIQIINEQIGRYLIPYSDHGLPTIGEIISQGKRVLLGYAYKFDVRQFPDSQLFWPQVQQLWANTDKFVNLEQYIAEQICKSSNQYRNKHHLRSVMAELTPTIDGILFRRYHGLREMAAEVNFHFEQWFRYQWWQCTNIVAADFFLGSDIVEISIDVNRRRLTRKVF